MIVTPLAIPRPQAHPTQVGLFTPRYLGASGPAQQDFRQALYAKLGSLAGLTSIVGSAIYPNVASQVHDFVADGPALTYAVASRTSGHALSGSDGTSLARVQFQALATSVATTAAIVEALRDEIDGVVLESWGNGTIEVMSCLQDGDDDDPYLAQTGTDTWIYLQNTEYSIHFRVPLPSLK